MQKYLLPTIAALTMAFTGTVQADSIIVPNFSFNSPAIPDGSTSASSSSDTGFITGWTIDNSNSNNAPFGVVSTSTLNSPGTADGSQVGFMDVFFNNPDSMKISTSTSATIAANTTYTLTFALGTPVNPPQGVGIVGEVAPTDTISLLANGTAFASAVVANTSVPEGTLGDFSVTFTTGTTDLIIGQNLGISLLAVKSFYPADPGFEATVFDNVRLTEVSSVPEPTTWALMLGGMGLLVFLTRRNLRKA